MNNLSMRIAEHVFVNNGYVYGGFVRDLIAEDPFENMDIYLGTSERNVSAFLLSLMKEYDVYNIEYVKSYSDDLVICKCIIADNDNEVPIHCVTSMGEDSPFRKGTDVDTNCLYLDKGWAIQSVPWYECVRVIDHIYNYEFITEASVSYDRVQKMLNKNYVWVNK